MLIESPTTLDVVLGVALCGRGRMHPLEAESGKRLGHTGLALLLRECHHHSFLVVQFYAVYPIRDHRRDAVVAHAPCRVHFQCRQFCPSSVEGCLALLLRIQVPLI